MGDILIPIALFVLIGFLAWVIFSTIRRASIARAQAGVQLRLLEKLESSQALLSYAETEAGRQLLKSFSVEQTGRATPYKSILIGVQIAILLVVFGAAVLILHGYKVAPSDDYIGMGVLAVALGIGFAIAAAATFYLSRSFGLFDGTQSSE